MFHIKYILITCGLISFANTSHSQLEFPDELTRIEIESDTLSAICQQGVVRFPNYDFAAGSTSFFISRNCLLTSAHNVTKLPFHSAKYMTLYPARIRDEKPFDSIELTINYKNNIRYPKRYNYYIKRTRKMHDMALIYLPDELIQKNSLLTGIQTMRILDETDSLRVGDTIYCAGYPAHGEYVGKFVMTMDTSVVKEIYHDYFTHDLETLKGNSGSPIMVKRNNQFFVVGVNSIKHCGTYLNQEKMSLIREWQATLRKRNQSL